MVLQIALALIAAPQDRLQDAIEVARAFGRRIEKIAPSQPVLASAFEQAKVNSNTAIEVTTVWGWQFVDPLTMRILAFQGYTDSKDSKRRSRWQEDETIPSEQARALAIQYAKAAWEEVEVSVADDGQSETGYSFSGHVLVTGLPLLESAVEVEVGHVSGSLAHLHLDHGTADGSVPSTTDDPTPKLSSADAILIAADDAEKPGRAGTYVTWGPFLGWLCPQRRKGWFDNLTPSELNDFNLNRARLVYLVTVRAFDPAGTPFTRLEYVDAHSGRVLEGNESSGFGIGKSIREIIPSAPAKIEAFGQDGKSTAYVTRLTRVTRPASFRGKHHRVLGINGVTWVPLYDPRLQLLVFGADEKWAYRPSAEIARLLDGAAKQRK
jgi:hypothetical protein